MNTTLKQHAVPSPWANATLLITTVIYLLINGAGLWEAANVVPLWTSAPPASFHIFQGEYGLRYKAFWIISHSIHEVFFIAAIILNWRIKYRKNPLLIIFVIHFSVRVWTLAYFAPILISFWDYPYSETVDVALKAKADAWEFWSNVRGAIFMLLSFALIPLNKQFFILK
ncbi:MAG: transposase [Cyclobacteriaceae bacterium]|nr:transposase [Cyclobacteriaceae bacterium]